MYLMHLIGWIFFMHGMLFMGWIFFLCWVFFIWWMLFKVRMFFYVLNAFIFNIFYRLNVFVAECFENLHLWLNRNILVAYIFKLNWFLSVERCNIWTAIIYHLAHLNVLIQYSSRVFQKISFVNLCNIFHDDVTFILFVNFHFEWKKFEEKRESYKKWISQEWKELFRWNENYFSY